CIPDEDVLEMVEVMRAAHWHTFQVLTKRAGRLRRIGQKIDWPENVWVGESVENNDFLPRVEALSIGARKATVRYIPYEPALGPLWLTQPKSTALGRASSVYEAADALGNYLRLHKIDWVICGAESGEGARPMDNAWARQAR